MASSCAKERHNLIECLADSQCIADGRSISQCMELDESCRALRVAFYTCKRGQLDMRKRIKGNMPNNDSYPEPEPPENSG